MDAVVGAADTDAAAAAVAVFVVIVYCFIYETISVNSNELTCGFVTETLLYIHCVEL